MIWTITQDTPLQPSSTTFDHNSVLIAAQVIAGHHILVTRNTTDFQDLLPAQQLQNWIDEAIS